MAKRRRRRLGSAPIKHRAQLDPLARRISAELHVTEAAVDGGRCRTAAQSLLKLAAGFGEYNTHARAGEGSAAGIGVSSGRYDRVKGAFFERCLRR